MFELYGIPFEGETELVATFACECRANAYKRQSRLAAAPFNHSSPSKARWDAGQAYIYRASSLLRNYLDSYVCIVKPRKEIPHNPENPRDAWCK
jgi:hypothetical protein